MRNKIAKQIANLLINEGKLMEKKCSRTIDELIMPSELSVIATSMVVGLITKAEGRKLFCDRCKEVVKLETIAQ